MNENTVFIVLIICVCVFLFAFVLLYFKHIKKIFVWIKNGIVSMFKKKNNSKKQEKKSNKVVKSEMQTRPILLPKDKQKQLTLNTAQEEIKTSKKFTFENKEADRQEFERSRQKLKKLADITLDDDDDENSVDLPKRVKSFEEHNVDDEIVEKLKNNSTIDVDGEEVDLNRLPVQIRRLLLSGILDRKDDN